MEVALLAHGVLPTSLRPRSSDGDGGGCYLRVRPSGQRINAGRAECGQRRAGTYQVAPRHLSSTSATASMESLPSRWILLGLGAAGGAANLALRRPQPVEAQPAKV